MNANHNRVVDFCVNGVHDHYINDKKHVQPHNSKRWATKSRKRGK